MTKRTDIQQRRLEGLEAEFRCAQYAQRCAVGRLGPNSLLIGHSERRNVPAVNVGESVFLGQITRRMRTSA